MEDAKISMKTTLKILLIVLFVIWMLPGLVGRDPWMNDEPYSFGLVNHIVKTNDWVVPTLAGEPFMEKPPVILPDCRRFFVDSFSTTSAS